MKNDNRSRRRRTAAPSEVDVNDIRSAMEILCRQAHWYWSSEILSDAPDWPHLLAAHLRICELEHIEQAIEELA